MKYDDASWHSGGDFPADLPPEAGATHIGMFVAWAMLNGLAGPIHTEDFPETLTKLRRRETTPGAWFLDACDGKFTNEDLTDEGNSFAQAYYADQDAARLGLPSFLGDYEAAFRTTGLEAYRVPDSWESFERIAPMISRRFMKWRNSQRGWKRFIPGLG